ncbi:DUF2637 domain-containing protein [Streptomyces sp. NPDC001118]
MERDASSIQLTRTQRALVLGVVAGAVVIAAIGFVGSYAAVRDLAIRKGFGQFAKVLPIGVDAGIAVLLSLDLLLTWMRMPFPMLRQSAWLLTVATIAFNAATAWPDPIGVGMHAVIPVLFVVTVEAARHAIGRLAAITADRYIEGVRVWRWLLAPVPTFLLWRRMQLWELRSYSQVIKLEQERLIYQARLRSRFGRRWRRKAPVEEILPLRFARYGVSLEEATRSLGLAARPGVAEVEPSPATSGFSDETATGPAPETLRDESKRIELPGTVYAPTPPSDAAATGADEAEVVTGTGDAVPQAGEIAPRGSHQQKGMELSRQEVTGSAHGDALDSSPAPRSAPQPAARNEAPARDTPGRPAPSEAGRAGQQQRQETDDEEQDDDKGPVVEPDPEHTKAIADMRTNAEAVRYAMKILGSNSTPQVVDWLQVHGRTVNRGQAHKIIQAGQPGQRQRLEVVKKIS